VQYADVDLPIARRCLSIFQDFLSEILDGLEEYIIEYAPGDANKALECLERLISSIINPIRSKKESTITETQVDVSGKKSDIDFGVEVPLKARFRATKGQDHHAEKTRSESFKVAAEEKIIFTGIVKFLAETLRSANLTLYILFDEWSSLAMDLQPYLAEYIKRSIFPCERVVLKIASIEYRSKFSIPGIEPTVGFELGADISTSAGLDDYYIFDIDPERLLLNYSDMLFRHVNSELPFDYLRKQHHVSDSASFVDKVSESGTFSELSRASEGIVRDLIQIFSRAFSLTYKKRHERPLRRINRTIIIEAATDWFNRDKFQYFEYEMISVCENIERVVVGKNKSRFFLFPIKTKIPNLLQKLMDARVIHLVHRNISVPSAQGKRFCVYAVDYGFYMSMVYPGKIPTRAMAAWKKDPKVVSPFDTEKDPLRLIVDEVLFDPFIK
jgi:hypothetical protein